MPEKSNCCNADIKVSSDAGEGTSFYVCTKCNKPCDRAVISVVPQKLFKRTSKNK